MLWRDQPRPPPTVGELEQTVYLTEASQVWWLLSSTNFHSISSQVDPASTADTDSNPNSNTTSQVDSEVEDSEDEDDVSFDASIYQRSFGGGTMV